MATFYAMRSTWIGYVSLARIQSVKRDKLLFRLLTQYFAYVARMAKTLDAYASDRAECQLELIRAEDVWCEFFGGIDDQLADLPSEHLAEAWAARRFEEFQTKLREVLAE
jgi:hypothetical protein